MSRSYNERDASLAITCPTCGAEPTMVCVEGLVTTREVHQERLDELHDLVMKGAMAYDAEDMHP